VHALALDAFYGSAEDSWLEIFSKDVSLKLAEGSQARSLLETATETWREHLPGNADYLFAWCLEQSDDRLLDLLAHCAALSVNAVQAKVDRPDCERLAHAQALAQARPHTADVARRSGYRLDDARDWLCNSPSKTQTQGIVRPNSRRVAKTAISAGTEQRSS
jgi:hypothetical protein